MSADNVVEMAVWTCSLEDDMRSFLSFVRRAVWAIGSWSVRYSECISHCSVVWMRNNTLRSSNSDSKTEISSA